MNYEERYFDKAELHKKDLIFIIDEMLEARQANDENALMVYNSLGQDLQNGLETTFIAGPHTPSVADIYLFSNVSHILQLMTWQNAQRESAEGAQYFPKTARAALRIKYPSVELWLRHFEDDIDIKPIVQRFEQEYITRLYQ